MRRIFTISIIFLLFFSLCRKDCNSNNSSNTAQLVTEIYVATFERAPALAGLRYWTDIVDTGVFTIDQVAQSFFDQPETQAKFPEESSNTEFITTVYNNTLSRDPAEAGLAYWVDALDRGVFRRDQAIMTIINGAKAETGSATDAAMLAKKTEIGLLFANSEIGDLNTNENFMDWSKGIISRAERDDFSLNEAEAYIDYCKEYGDVPPENEILTINMLSGSYRLKAFTVEYDSGVTIDQDNIHDFSGTMSIYADGSMTQTISINGSSYTVSGNLGIIDNETLIVSSLGYTYNMEISFVDNTLTTYLESGVFYGQNYSETNVWGKVSSMPIRKAYSMSKSENVESESDKCFVGGVIGKYFE